MEKEQDALEEAKAEAENKQPEPSMSEPPRTPEVVKQMGTKLHREAKELAAACLPSDHPMVKLTQSFCGHRRASAQLLPGLVSRGSTEPVKFTRTPAKPAPPKTPERVLSPSSAKEKASKPLDDDDENLPSRPGSSSTGANLVLEGDGRDMMLELQEQMANMDQLCAGEDDNEDEEGDGRRHRKSRNVFAEYMAYRH